MQPTLEPFRSARSAWLPAALFWSLELAAGFLFLGGTRIGGALALGVAVLGLASILLELSFRRNLLAWALPRGNSQNVWATVGAQRSSGNAVVVVAHVDTHRTPLAFSSDRWVRWFERLVPVGLVFAVALIAIVAADLIHPLPWLRYAALPSVAVALALLMLMLQADFTPFAPGANDNASGVGVLLSLAEVLAARPLEHLDVTLLFTGCEEVGAYGARAFLHRYGAAMRGAAWIAVDTVASRRGAPVFLSQETFLTTQRSDPELLDMARRIAARRPELGAREVRVKGAYTDGAIGAKHGLRTLTLESRGPDETLSEWHRLTDTTDRLSADCLEKTELLLVELLGAMDDRARAAGEGKLAQPRTTR